MSSKSKALLWAAIIIAAAFVANGQGMSDSASFALISGLTTAAVASTYSSRRQKGCCS